MAMARDVTLDVGGTKLSGLPAQPEGFLEAAAHPATFPTVAGEVRVPVQYVIAASEASSVSGPDVLARSLAAFTAAPHVETFIQPASGHNISAHRVAGGYHLRVPAYEDCLARLDAR
jgi:hypothetical protein